jgi:hypothetical protein
MRCCFAAAKQKALLEEQGFLVLNSLTITYFHTGTRTIIGVESFHGPVRDGKGWYQLAVVIRHDLLLSSFAAGPIWEEEFVGCERIGQHTTLTPRGGQTHVL